MYDIYIITCSVNKKKYIGLTSKGYEKRWKEHQYAALHGRTKTALYNSMRKYNYNSFSIKKIYSCTTLKEACRLEKEHILKFDTMTPTGYNLTEGGEGAIHGVETKAKLSKINMGKRLSEETKQKLRLATNIQFSTDESRQKISESRKKYWSDPLTRKRQSELKIQQFIDNPKIRKAISKASRKRFKDPIQRKKVIDRSRKYWANQKSREKQGVLKNQQYRDRPELKEKISNSIKEYYANNPQEKINRKNEMKAYRTTHPEIKEKLRKSREVKRIRRKSKWVGNLGSQAA